MEKDNQNKDLNKKELISDESLKEEKNENQNEKVQTDESINDETKHNLEEEQLLKEINNRENKFPIFLVSMIVVIVVGLFLAYQNKVYYSFALIPNMQVDKALENTEQDRLIRLSIHNPIDKFAFLIDEKNRKDEYQGDFRMELISGEERYTFNSQYYVDEFNEILQSGLYKRYIQINNNNEFKKQEVDEKFIKYSLLGDRKVINTVDGKEVTFTKELKRDEASKILSLRNFEFNNTVYGNWYNAEDEVRKVLIPDSKGFSNFKENMEEFLLATDLHSAKIYSTFKNDKLETWGVDLIFHFIDADGRTTEWKVYFDIFYSDNDEPIKQKSLNELNSITFSELNADLYNGEADSYFKNDMKNEDKDKGSSLDDTSLNISIEELDQLLLNGDSRVKSDKETSTDKSKE